MITSLFTRTYLTTPVISMQNKLEGSIRAFDIHEFGRLKRNATTQEVHDYFLNMKDKVLKDNSYSYNFIVCDGIHQYQTILCRYFQLLGLDQDNIKPVITILSNHSVLSQTIWKVMGWKFKDYESQIFYIQSTLDMYNDKKYYRDKPLLDYTRDYGFIKELPLEWIATYIDDEHYLVHDLVLNKLESFRLYSLMQYIMKVMSFMFTHSIPLPPELVMINKYDKSYNELKDFWQSNPDVLEKTIRLCINQLEDTIENDKDISDNDKSDLQRLYNILEIFYYPAKKVFTSRNIIDNSSMFDFGYSGINIFKINKSLMLYNIDNHIGVSMSYDLEDDKE